MLWARAWHLHLYQWLIAWCSGYQQLHVDPVGGWHPAAGCTRFALLLTRMLSRCSAAAAWHLAWVRAVNLDTGVRALFVANTWLDLTIPGSNSWLRLTAGPDQPLAAPVPSSPRQSPLQPVSARLTRNWSFPSKLGQPGYQVTLHTSNIMAVSEWWAGLSGLSVFVITPLSHDAGLLAAKFGVHALICWPPSQ